MIANTKKMNKPTKKIGMLLTTIVEAKLQKAK